MAGDENRLTGYAALPFNLNPYLVDFGEDALGRRPRPARRRLRLRLRQPLPGRRRRVHIPALGERRHAAGGDAALAYGEARGPAVDSAERQGLGDRSLSLQARSAARRSSAAIVGGVARVDTCKLKPGTTLLRLQVSDHQESRNMENVGPILPNTRVLTARVTITR